MLERIQVEREARAFVSVGEWEKAISLYRELLAKGDDPNAYNLIGDIYTRIGDLRSAAPEYIRAIELYEKEGLFENGIAVCKKMLRIMPEKQEICFNLAIFYAEVGLLNEAFNVLKNYVDSVASTTRTSVAGINVKKYSKLIRSLANEPTLKQEVAKIYTKLVIREKELDTILGLEQIEKTGKEEAVKPSANEEVKLKVSTKAPAEDLSTIKTDYEKTGKEETVKPSTDEEVKLKVSTQTSAEDLSTIKTGYEKDLSATKSDMTRGNIILEKLIKEREEKPISASRSSSASINNLHSPFSAKRADDLSGEIKKKDGDIIAKDLQFLLHSINEIKYASRSGELPFSIQKKGHYKVGIEYKNLGFYNSAIKELQIASANPAYKLKALKELGFCFMEKGEPDFALTAFNRAMEERKTGEDYIELKYAIGLACQMIGDTASALKSYEEVHLIDVEYKDVKKKISELKK